MKEQLNKLFKPYKLEFQTIKDVKKKSTRLSKIFDEKRIAKRLIKNQCSKSEDRSCGNVDCQYNLLRYNYFDGVFDD